MLARRLLKTRTGWPRTFMFSISIELEGHDSRKEECTEGISYDRKTTQTGRTVSSHTTRIATRPSMAKPSCIKVQ